MRVQVVVAAAAMALAQSIGGCGAAANHFPLSDDESSVVDSGGLGDDVADLWGDASRDGSGACALTCSSDLHDVLDCSGRVVTQCPPDEGCAPGGACVAACDSANANQSTFGCEYFAAVPDVISIVQGACFAAFVANTWGSPVTIKADWNGTPLDVASAARIPQGSGQSLTYQSAPGGVVQPGQVAIVFLNRHGTSNGGLPNVDCPSGITAAVTSTDAAVHGTGRGHAFHLATDRPVAAFDMFPYGGGQSAATSATLLVPTSAWDVNYVAVNAFRKDMAVAMAQPFLQIVARENDTKVTISPTAPIDGGGGVDPTGKGQPHDYHLDRGQYLQITQDLELTGSAILSDKPVGVWGGATCLNIDVGDFYCDSAHQQLFPVRALGHEYAAVRYRARFDTKPNEVVPWRLVGAVDGTTLGYDPAAPQGAPTTLANGQVAEVWTSDPFVVRSQDDKHPFYVSGHMTGAAKIGPLNDGRGDPEFVDVIPPQEYLMSYVFFTDPTYPETDLVLVRTKGPNGFADVSLDCAGTVGGWTPLGANYEFTRVDLVRHDFQPQGSCNNGRHEIRSDVPFGLTVWGWGTAETGAYGKGIYSQYVSYAYPGGASVQPINTVVVPPTPK